MKTLIDFNRKGILSCEGHVFKPGMNSVEKAVWEKIKKHPIVKIYLEDGTLVEQEVDSNDEPDQAAVNHLKKMNVKDAIDAATRTIDVPLLKAWLAAEGRKTVKEKIQLQIDMIEGKAPQQAGAASTGSTANATENLGHNLDEDKIK